MGLNHLLRNLNLQQPHIIKQTITCTNWCQHQRLTNRHETNDSFKVRAFYYRHYMSLRLERNIAFKSDSYKKSMKFLQKANNKIRKVRNSCRPCTFMNLVIKKSTNFLQKANNKIRYVRNSCRPCTIMNPVIKILFSE